MHMELASRSSINKGRLIRNEVDIKAQRRSIKQKDVKRECVWAQNKKSHAGSFSG